MLIDIVVRAIAFATILLGAELFTNGIEWFGHKLGLSEGAIGSVLAAVGTALPETMIPLIAIVFTVGGGGNEIGVGAILGATFMLSTLAMFVTGVAVLAVAGRRVNGDVMTVSSSVLSHDIRTFVLAYALAVGVAFLPSDLVWPRLVTAAGMLVIYAWYVRAHLRSDAPPTESDGLAPLRLHPLDRRAPAHLPDPRLRIVTVQVLVALGCIIVGAYVFVGAVEDLAKTLGADEALLALVIAPIATELPEKFNSNLWVRQGKDTLAMGNITGAMVFQSTIPTVIGLVFASSHWAITDASLLSFASAGIAFAACAAIFLPMLVRGRLNGRGLLVGGLFYVAYIGLVLVRLSSAG